MSFFVLPYAVELYLQEKSHPSDRAECHFDLNSKIGAMYRTRYLNDGYFETLELLKEVAVGTYPDLAHKYCPMLTQTAHMQNKHSLHRTEIALRWIQHHSALLPTDGVIIGASSKSQLEQNGEDCLKGPLDQDIVNALDEARRIVVAHGSTPRYWR